MGVLLLLAGILLVAVGGSVVFIGLRSAISVRTHLREKTGESMGPVKAEIIVIGAWTIAILFGVGLIWKSRHL
jgi:hypothetical protein